MKISVRFSIGGADADRNVSEVASIGFTSDKIVPSPCFVPKLDTPSFDGRHPSILHGRPVDRRYHARMPEQKASGAWEERMMRRPTLTHDA
jgi:hypothetical protein